MSECYAVSSQASAFDTGGDVVLINRQFIGPSDLAVPVISSGVFASIRRSRYVFGDVRVRDEG